MYAQRKVQDTRLLLVICHVLRTRLLFISQRRNVTGSSKKPNGPNAAAAALPRWSPFMFSDITLACAHLRTMILQLSYTPDSLCLVAIPDCISFRKMLDIGKKGLSCRILCSRKRRRVSIARTRLTSLGAFSLRDKVSRIFYPKALNPAVWSSTLLSTHPLHLIITPAVDFAVATSGSRVFVLANGFCGYTLDFYSLHWKNFVKIFPKQRWIASLLEKLWMKYVFCT